MRIVKIALCALILKAGAAPRAEAQNVFDIRGYGPVQSQIGNANYGLITTAGNLPRQIQMSARFVF